MAQNPSPEWPKAIYKRGFEVRYAHNDKELKKLLEPAERGGYGGTLEVLREEWPRVLYHKTLPPQTVGLVTNSDEQNEAEEERWAMKGYQREPIARVEPSQVVASAEPPATRIDKLEGDVAGMKDTLNKILEALGTPKRGRKGEAA